MSGQHFCALPRWISPLIMMGLSLTLSWFLISEVAGSPALLTYNLAFDFDPGRFIRLWGMAPELLQPRDITPDFYVKHPLIGLFRPLVLGGVFLGFSPDEVCLGLMAMAVGVSVVWLDRLGITLSIPWPERTLLNLCWLVGTTPLICVITPESYGLTLPMTVWLMAQLTPDSRVRNPSLRQWIGAGAYMTGVTLTNFIMVGVVAWGREGRHSLRRMSLAAAGVMLVVSIGVWVQFPQIPYQVIEDPVKATKTLFSARVYPSERVGLGQVFVSFAGYNFVAPQLDQVPIEQGARLMWDLRTFKFTIPGIGALLSWSVLMGLGMATLWSLRMDTRVKVWAGLTLFHLIFHLWFQFRGSVFLYGAHTYALFFYPALVWTSRRYGEVGSRPTYPRLLLVTTCVLMGWNNLNWMASLLSLLRGWRP